MGRDDLVSKVTWYSLDNWGFDFRQEIFVSAQTGFGTNPPIPWILRGFPPRLKPPKRKAEAEKNKIPALRRFSDAAQEKP
jgi:hypothetical protein